MANNKPRSHTLKLPGKKLESKPLPLFMASTARGVAANEHDALLPADYVQVLEACDLSQRSRAAAAGQMVSLNVAAGNVIVIELADGVTVVTSADRLRATLAEVAPKAIDADGNLYLDRLGERAAESRGIAEWGNAVSRVFTLDVGSVTDTIIEEALEKLKELAGAKAELGVSWLGTKALMWAIEKQIKGDSNLYQWDKVVGNDRARDAATDKELETASGAGPLLVFIHGTASSTRGSFSDLQSSSREGWRRLEEKFLNRIFAFEHRTLSESPIENALRLAQRLPAGATINLVTHSRGGLVGDLLCLARLGDKDKALIKQFALDDFALAGTSGKEREDLASELESAYKKHREDLKALGELLQQKNLTIDRYVRVACPARGTRLASSNIDVFLSGLLTLIGTIPALAVSPLYAAFKRVVLEIAKRRTNPNLVPGIEAQLPESPLARLLARCTVPSSVRQAVISGDIEGGGLLKRLGVLFTDHMFFDGVDNDLVVDTSSMYGGIAHPTRTFYYFDKGPDVNHFHYFSNRRTRRALTRWLLSETPQEVEPFALLPGFDPEPTTALAADRGVRRGIERAGLGDKAPVVIVLPGIMGSHLQVPRANGDGWDRVWFDFDDLLAGGFRKIEWGANSVAPEALFERYYGDLCDYLEETHRVVRYAYDWRLPLDQSGSLFDEELKKQLAATTAPVRVLAHSMGGLVVRAMIHQSPARFDALMQRDGARLVMLGTPNQGSHLMVETLIGKANTVRMLGAMDQKHDLQKLLDMIAEFRGALQLLPSPCLRVNGEADRRGYFERETWKQLKAQMRDWWFGDQIAGVPSTKALEQGRWLWDQDGTHPALPDQHKANTIYVHGRAKNTPCGIEQKGNQSWKTVATWRGDGTVTWDSGAIDGIGTRYWMDAEHGALTSTKAHFGTLVELLESGKTSRLVDKEPTTRGVERNALITYDAGPPVYPTELELAAELVGAPKSARPQPHAKPALHVKVRAMDLRKVTCPILVGHLEQDPIAGAEALIDRELVEGQLSVRHNLGLYPGAIGTATVVLLRRNTLERQRRSWRGAVVTGLGPYDGTLTPSTLTESVRTAGLSYLLQVHDPVPSDQAEGELRLATLLLGYNSSANLTLDDSVGALLRGVVDANLKFAEATQSSMQITKLEIVELYLDTAISSVYALKRAAAAINAEPQARYQIEVEAELDQGEGARPRLEAQRNDSYWPRLLVTNGDDPESASKRATSECDDETQDDSSTTAPKRQYAEKLKFMYLGPRARAESVFLQSQPGQVESLVEEQQKNPVYLEKFSRTLFNLLVPFDLKDTLRQQSRLVLALDGYTANFPWELVLAGPTPLGLKTPLVRQLLTTKFRTRVSQTVENRALVIGNPSTAGFVASFCKHGVEGDRLASLDGAKHEAEAVRAVLRKHGVAVLPSSPEDDQPANDVINALNEAPYRIIHIAAHGIYDLPHRNGGRRTGVVLSEGRCITAAEIQALEVVPEVAFLNCCHLGQIDATSNCFNQLAYSISRELIECGVRCVVVAGWAVQDNPARQFAEAFYQELIGNNLPFGEAVFAARKAAAEAGAESVTWGAYQAYGDPSWRFDAKRPPGKASRTTSDSLVSPLELIDRIQQNHASIRRHKAPMSESELDSYYSEVKRLVEGSPSAWLRRGDVSAALGQFYAETGERGFSEAVEAYSQAAKMEPENSAPLRVIERLANLETLSASTVEGVRKGLARLNHLERAIEGTDDNSAPLPEPSSHERAGLMGSAWKRIARLSAESSKWAEFEAALEKSRHYYRAKHQDSDTEAIDPYLALNALFLGAFEGNQADRAALVPLARECAAVANDRFSRTSDFWDAIMVIDAALAEALLETSLEQDDASKIVEQLANQYDEARTGVGATPREMNSTLNQLKLLREFSRAKQSSGDTSRLWAALEQSLHELWWRVTAKSKEPESADSTDGGPDSDAKNARTDVRVPVKKAGSKSTSAPKPKAKHKRKP